MLIDAQGLGRTYRIGPAEVQALRGVDLEVDAGEFVAIMGPSGSGKSTLLYLLGCLDRPSAGRYRLAGKAVERLPDDELSALRNRKIGFIFQSFNLIPHQTVLANVELPLVYAGVERHARRERCRDALERLGLAAKAAHRPAELSGGELQRAAIARAVVVEPLLLLGDEPTGNLDSRTGAETMRLLVELNRRGTTIVLVTHDREIAAQAARQVEMRDGRIVGDRGGDRAVVG